MKLVDEVLSEPEFRERPPVLVDIGAAGGVPPGWKSIARHSVVLAFEPDAREAAILTEAQQRFREWIYVPAIVAPTLPPGGTVELFLTRSPQCSSTLQPDTDALKVWAFAGLFDVVEKRDLQAVTLLDALRRHHLPGIDYLKCDTQGTDLRLFRSLPEPMRYRVLVAEFEPGLIDAYHGEDRLPELMTAMRAEPFWLAEFRVQRTQLALHGRNASQWYRRVAPTAPAWGNLCYLRALDAAPDLLDRRAYLLLWVFATLQDQPAFAHNVAMSAAARFGGPLFTRMTRASLRQLHRMMLMRIPRWILYRFLR
jgi:FkbM family methyltransferase